MNTEMIELEHLPSPEQHAEKIARWYQDILRANQNDCYEAYSTIRDYVPASPEDREALVKLARADMALVRADIASIDAE